MFGWFKRRGGIDKAARQLGQRSAEVAAQRRTRERQKIIALALQMRRELNMPEWQSERDDNG